MLKILIYPCYVNIHLNSAEPKQMLQSPHEGAGAKSCTTAETDLFFYVR